MKEKLLTIIRKPWFIAAAAFIVIFVCGIIVFAVIMNKPAPFSGEGTQENPYIISNKEDLYAFNNYAGNAIDGHAGEYFLLESDIDLGGDDWVPVAGGRMFAGVFDGNNHTISNFKITTGLTNVGFFSYISGGEEAGIYNLNLSGVSLVDDMDTHSLGVLVGFADARIENCSVEATIVLSGRNAYVGGVVGYTNCSVTGCRSSGTMTVSATERLPGTNSTYEWPDYAGVVGSTISDITDTVNYMEIKMTRLVSSDTVKRNIHTGGICGNANGTYYSNLINYADIKGVGAVGGIIGTISNETAVVSGCYNYGDLFTTGDVLCDIGGIVARSFTYGSILPSVENCYNGGEIELLSILNGTVSGGYELIACWAGGIIGVGNFNVSACASVGDMVIRGTDTHYVGGIAGGITGVLKDSYHIGDIIVESDSSIIAGGVLGVLQSHEYYYGLIDDLVITIERCYNAGEVFINLTDNPLSAAANYLAGGVVGYNMQSRNVIKYNYFDITKHQSEIAPEGFIAYIYWYGEENAGQADNVESDSIISNSGLTTQQFYNGELEGFEEYSSSTGEGAVWVFSGEGYPTLYWQNIE